MKAWADPEGRTMDAFIAITSSILAFLILVKLGCIGVNQYVFLSIFAVLFIMTYMVVRGVHEKWASA